MEISIMIPGKKSTKHLRSFLLGQLLQLYISVLCDFFKFDIARREEGNGKESNVMKHNNPRIVFNRVYRVSHDATRFLHRI